MEINNQFLVIPCLTLVFIFIKLNLDFKIYKYYEVKNLSYLKKSEPSGIKRILVWNNTLKNRDFLKGYKIQMITYSFIDKSFVLDQL